MLRSEGEMYAEKMRRYGVDVVLKEYKGEVVCLWCEGCLADWYFCRFYVPTC